MVNTEAVLRTDPTERFVVGESYLVLDDVRGFLDNPVRSFARQSVFMLRQGDWVQCQLMPVDTVEGNPLPMKIFIPIGNTLKRLNWRAPRPFRIDSADLSKLQPVNEPSSQEE